MRGFREVVNDCNLTDIVLEGYPFTWWKSRGSNRAVEERLDRAMVSTSRGQLFPEARLLNLIAPISDHSPILPQCEVKNFFPPRKCFKFENAWLLEPDMDNMVHRGWQHGQGRDVL